MWPSLMAKNGVEGVNFKKDGEAAEKAMQIAKMAAKASPKEASE